MKLKKALKESKQQIAYTVGGYQGEDDPMAKKDIRKASLYDVDAYMEQLDDGSWELVITGDVDKVKDYVDNYLGLDSTGLVESLKEDADARKKFYTKDYFTKLVSWDKEDCERLHDYLEENPQVVKYAKSALKRDHKRYSKGETDQDYLDMVNKDLEEQEYYLNNFSDAVFRLDTIVRDNLFKAIIDGIKKYGADTLKESVEGDKETYFATIEPHSGHFEYAKDSDTKTAQDIIDNAVRETGVTKVRSWFKDFYYGDRQQVEKFASICKNNLDDFLWIVKGAEILTPEIKKALGLKLDDTVEDDETIKVPNDAWKYIDKIVDKYFGKGEGWEEKINKEVEDLFNRHKGDSVWEK